MKLSPFKLLMVLAVASAGWPLMAQESIIYSPPSDEKSDQPNPIMVNPDRQVSAGDYNAPRKIFNNFAPILPMPQPIYYGNTDPAVLDALNKRRNWTLLTPAQILGVQTPEEILGLDSLKPENKMSLDQQFLMRLESKSASGVNAGIATYGTTPDHSEYNKYDGSDPSGRGNPFNRAKNNKLDFSSGSTGNGLLKAGQSDAQDNYFKQFFNEVDSASSRQQTSGFQQRSDSPWTSPFAQPNQPKISQDQIDAMDRFRALMNPGASPNATPISYSTPAKPVPDPYLQKQPQYNPVGRSFAPLGSDAAGPTGIQPLPGLTGPTQKSAAGRPSWQAQMPPWMQGGPQPH